MFFIYNENVPKGDGDFNSSKFNPNKMYMIHFENYLMLNLEMRRAQEEHSIIKIHQATKELAIATKKMEWWSKRPGYDHDIILIETLAAKKLWRLEDL